MLPMENQKSIGSDWGILVLVAGSMR